MAITEKEYLEALRVVREYSEQIKSQSEIVLTNTELLKTPKEINAIHGRYAWSSIFPKMPTRVWGILNSSLEDRRICDITRKEFLKCRLAGPHSWIELCKTTGNTP